MRRLIVVSNRLPLVIAKTEDEFRIREGAGGLVTALKPLVSEHGGAWVGFCGMFEEDRGTGWEPTLAEYGDGSIRYYPVVPGKNTYDGYYLQYANQELWPRFHELTSRMSRSAAEYWSDYVALNQLFADETARVIRDDDLIWIQDYHLMLLPGMLRKSHPRAALGHFLHIPFPAAEIMQQQPHAAQIMRGVLSCDLVGFHIPAYMDHFVEAAQRIVDAQVVQRDTTRVVMDCHGHRVQLGAFPIGIDPGHLKTVMDTTTVRRRLRGTADRLILSMDRLDYTKAIPPRLEAYGRLLDESPPYRERVSLVQLLDMSRTDIPAYQEEKEKVDRIVHSINDRYQSWKSLFFEAKRWKRKEVAGLMHLAEICLVTPRCDGMNLVSKEYIAAAPEDGVLVLSRQAGAAWQLSEHAVMVDGNSTDSILDGLRTALEMPTDERLTRMARLKNNVRQQDVYWWAGGFLRALGSETPYSSALSGPDAKPMALDSMNQITEWLQGRELALMLDYDGTLTPIVRRPEDAVLDPEVRGLLRKLAEHCCLAIVSGRDRLNVEGMVDIDTLTYAGSHGFDIHGPQVSMQHEAAQTALPALDQAEQQLNAEIGKIEGAHVERKRFAIAIHYREVASECNIALVEQAVDQAATQFPQLRKMGGKKIFELQPDVPWDKGQAVLWLRQTLNMNHAGVVSIYIGDDLTDEFAFRAMNQIDMGIGIRVAQSGAATAARYVLRNCDEVHEFLRRLLAAVQR